MAKVISKKRIIKGNSMFTRIKQMLDVEGLCEKLDKLSYTFLDIEKEMEVHREGAMFSKGYNLGLEDAKQVILTGTHSWIDAPENPHNKNG